MRDENEFFFGDEETLEAVKKFEDSLRSRKGLFFDVYEFESIIDYYLSADNVKKASEAIDIAFRIHPNSSEIQLRKAEILMMENKFNEAQSLLNYLIKIDPFNCEVFYFVGQVNIELGKNEASE